jgi:hypothetical protein
MAVRSICASTRAPRSRWGSRIRAAWAMASAVIETAGAGRSGPAAMTAEQPSVLIMMRISGEREQVEPKGALSRPHRLKPFPAVLSLSQRPRTKSLGLAAGPLISPCAQARSVRRAGSAFDFGNPTEAAGAGGAKALGLLGHSDRDYLQPRKACSVGEGGRRVEDYPSTELRRPVWMPQSVAHR